MCNSIVEQIQDMIDGLESLKKDALKFDVGGKGTNSAGTRVRLGLQEARNQAKEIRANISEIKSNALAAKSA